MEKPLTIAFIFAHPDDEHIPFGLPAELAKRGNHVQLISLTKGDLGSHSIRSRRKIAKIRKEEFKNSGKILNAERVTILGLPDGEITHSRKVKQRLLRELRLVDPDVIITQPPDYHQDHTKSGEIAQWATFHIKDSALITRRGLLRRKIPPTTKDISFYEMDTQGSQTWGQTTKDEGQEMLLNPVNLILPISPEAIEISTESFRQHKSQLQGQDYIDLAVKGAQRRGKQIGTDYAVGLNFRNFGGYAFSPQNILLSLFPHG